MGFYQRRKLFRGFCSNITALTSSLNFWISITSFFKTSLFRFLRIVPFKVSYLDNSVIINSNSFSSIALLWSAFETAVCFVVKSISINNTGSPTICSEAIDSRAFNGIPVVERARAHFTFCQCLLDGLFFGIPVVRM